MATNINDIKTDQNITGQTVTCCGTPMTPDQAFLDCLTCDSFICTRNDGTVHKITLHSPNGA